MGFPSPAQDYVEQRISLDQRIVTRPSATYYMKSSETIYRCGIMKDALLVIDSSLNPCDGSLLICRMESELRIKRYRNHPNPHLEDLQTGRRQEIPAYDDGTSPDAIFGVITYIINDARSGEFDDCPIM
ncbi:TPA: LexA family transcriptional regulator [Enterobacter hormaechei]|nr:LexA family transcriptional regulator [Enterobacter hormaechei]